MHTIITRLGLALGAIMLAVPGFTQLHPYFEKEIVPSDPNLYYGAGKPTFGPDGHIWVVGHLPQTVNNNDVVVFRYDARGNELWRHTLNIANSQEHATDLLLDGIGNAYVLSSYNAPGNGADWLITKISPSGQRLWIRSFGSSDSDWPTNLMLDKSGGVYAYGLAFSSERKSQNVLVKLRTIDGAPVWTYRAGDNLGYLPQLERRASLDSQGNAYINVDNYQTGRRMHKVSPSGALLQEIDLPDNLSFRDYEVNHDWLYVVGSEPEPYDGQPDYQKTTAVLLKLSLTGDLIWKRTAGLPDQVDVFTALEFDREGGIFAAYSFSKGQAAGAWVGKYTPAGARLWTADNVGGPIKVNPRGELLAWSGNHRTRQFNVAGEPAGEVEAAGIMDYNDSGAAVISVYAPNAANTGSNYKVMKFFRGLVGFSLSSPLVFGGHDVRATARLSEPATYPFVMDIISDSRYVTTPVRFTIPIGSIGNVFTVKTIPQNESVNTGIMVTKVGGAPQSMAAALRILKPVFVKFTTEKGDNPFLCGGDTYDGILTLSSPAPAGGVTIAVTDDTSAIETPSQVLVPAGQSTVKFPIKVNRITQPVQRTMSASYDGRKYTLLVSLSGGLDEVVITPESVKGGSSASGVVKFTGGANFAREAFLSSSNPAVATVPESVKGGGDLSFNVQTNPVTSTQTVTITARVDHVTRADTLQVTP